MKNKRNNIAAEILSTERAYVGNLRVLVKAYLQPIKEMSSTNGGAVANLFDSQLSTIFNDIEVILGYNSIILSDLEKRFAAWSNSQRLGDIFLKMADFLKAYTQYVNHYKKAQSTFAKLKYATGSEEALLLERLREGSDDPLKRSMRDFLIMPVQRIPRYAMLLKELVENTWEDHLDQVALSEALKKILYIADSVEESQEGTYSLAKVTEISYLLTGKNAEDLQLVQPHRRYVCDMGVMDMTSGGSRPLHIFLFNDILLYAVPTKKEKFNLEAELELHHVTSVKTGENTTDSTAVFVISTKGTRLLVLPSVHDRDTFVAEMEKYSREAAKTQAHLADTKMKAMAQSELRQKMKAGEKTPPISASVSSTAVGRSARCALTDSGANPLPDLSIAPSASTSSLPTYAGGLRRSDMSYSSPALPAQVAASSLHAASSSKRPTLTLKRAASKRENVSGSSSSSSVKSARGSRDKDRDGGSKSHRMSVPISVSTERGKQWHADREAQSDVEPSPRRRSRRLTVDGGHHQHDTGVSDDERLRRFHSVKNLLKTKKSPRNRGRSQKGQASAADVMDQPLGKLKN